MGAEVLAERDEQGGGAGAVVGADEGDVLERVVGFVVGDEDDDAVLLAGEFDDVVAHRLRAGGGVGGELVGFEVALGGFGLEVVLDEVFGGEVAGRAVEALGGGGEELLGEGVDGLAGDLGGGAALGGGR